MQKKILILSRDKELKKLLKGYLSEGGFIPNFSDSKRDLINQIEKESFDIILVDFNTRDLDGEELVEIVKEDYKHIEIIVLTDKETVDSAIELIQTGAFDYILKPPDLQKLRESIEKAILKQSVAYQFVDIPVPKQKKGKLPTLKRGAGAYVEGDNIFFSEVEWSLKGATLSKAAWANFSKETFGYQVGRFFSERLKLKKSEKKRVPGNGETDEKPAKGGSDSAKVKRGEILLNKILNSLVPERVKSRINVLKGKIKSSAIFKGGKEKKIIDPAKIREKKKGAILFATGISGQSVFFSAFAMTGEGAKKIDENILITENPRLALITSSSVVWDSAHLKIKKTSFSFVAAGRLKPVSLLLQSFYESGFQPIRIEPEPWAVLRASWYYAQPMAKKGVEIRFIFGESNALAFLTYGQAPIAWQLLELNQREKFFDTLLSSVITLGNYARGSLKIGDAEIITLQGGENLSDKAVSLEKMAEKPVSVLKGPLYDGHMVATGLALGSLAHDTLAINVAKRIQKPLSLTLLFPRGEAIVTAVLVLLVLLVAILRFDHLDKSLIRVKRFNAMAGLPPRKSIRTLETERDKLKAVVEPIGKFLGDKVLWTTHLLTLPALIPHNTRVVGVEVEDQIWQKMGGTTYGNRYMLISMATEFIEGGKTPQAIDETLNVFRDAKVFKDDFPKMDLATIFWKKEFGIENAFFALVAMPKQVEK